MINEPMISVVMAVYNSEKYVQEAVDSILKQTFKNFEFIIINDGSTDKTQEILESYNDPRIVLTHQKHMGLTKSLNKGIALAKGKYIARQDADDISLPDRLKKQIEFLELHKDFALLGTAAQIIDIRGFYLKTIKYPTDHSSLRIAIKRSNHFWHGSVMFRRQSFFELGGYQEIFFTAQDYDLWLRFVERFKVANLSDPLYKYRLNYLSLSFKKIVFQRRMAIFARELARAREKGIKERQIINVLESFLKLPLSVTEKREIIQIYNPWVRLLLSHNKKDQAFLLMNEVFGYHPSSLFKILFKITKTLKSAFFFEALIRMWFFLEKLRGSRKKSKYFKYTTVPLLPLDFSY
ncbi:MAG: glycosyltransferase family 2 protein [Promethearchaeota archaeon]